MLHNDCQALELFIFYRPLHNYYVEPMKLYFQKKENLDLHSSNDDALEPYIAKMTNQ